MGKQAPSAPDPARAAQAQAYYGEQAASYNKALNATNEYGPTGSTTNQIIGYDPMTGAPEWGQVTSLTQPEQQLLGGEQQGGLQEQQLASQTMGQVPNAPLYTVPQAQPLQTSLNTGNVPGMPTTSGTNSIQNQATQDVLAQQRAVLDPQWSQEEEQLKAQLVNSGNGPGTPAYENAMDRFQSQKASAYTQAVGAATTAGAQVGQTQYGEQAGAQQQIYAQDLQRFTAENQAKGMSEQDAIAAAQAQLSQRSGVAGLAATLYQSAAPTIPTASGIAPAQTAAPNFMQALQNQYQGELASYNANVGTENSLLSDAATIAAAYASDRRLKKALQKIGATAAGIPIYLFRYIWERDDAPLRRGVIAQEVLPIAPHAVRKDSRGFYLVNYAEVP